MKKSLASYPLFLFLLPVFFVLHGVAENFGLIRFRDAGILLLFYLGIALFFLVIGWIFYRNIIKAAFLAFCLLAYQFFFGAVQDLLQKSFPGTWINKYSVILPASLLMFILLIIFLKKRKSSGSRTVLYLNSLLLLLSGIETGTLLTKSFLTEKKQTPSGLSLNQCNECLRPDIYLILTDGYPGKNVTTQLLGYDNSAFEKALNNRGFSITDSSRSNYNFTAYSVASLLSMNYLNGIKKVNHDKNDISICQDAMNKSPFLAYLRKSGYEFYNYSIFNFEAHPSYTTPTFLPQKTVPITAQTFTRRVVRDLWYHLATTFKMPSVIRQYKYGDKINNEKLLKLTQALISRKSSHPKFVYTHLVMPHHPLFYDSAGRLYPIEQLGDFHYHDKKRRIEYLQYSNSILLELIDKIIKESPQPPVILLTGDHAIRELKEPFPDTYQFQTLSAWRMPDSTSLKTYNGASHVNQLRIFMNQQFRQRLPLLKDSTIMIAE